MLAKYESVGGPEGDLGFPTTNEVDGGLATGEPDEHLLRRGQAGHLLDARLRRVHRARRDERGLGQARTAPNGALGAPVADQTEDGNVISQRFSGGVVSWDRDEEQFTTEPANLASELTGLQVPGQNVPEAPARLAGIRLQ